VTRWRVPIRIVEKGRYAIVEAATKSDAVEKVLRRDWIECTDEIESDVTISKGRIEEDR